MDPIRSAVKFALIPLRTVVQLGELFVGSGEQQREQSAQPAAPQAAAPQPKSQAQRRSPARRGGASAQKTTQPRRSAPSRQASQAPKDLDDVGLARKVETVIFRDNSVPKGKIDVNAADGVVWLRGEAKTPDMIKTLESQANEIPEVKKVENLLHLPKTPAPTRTDTPPSQRKTRSSTRRPTARKVETGITNERRTTHGEALPEESARQGEGRQPSPLGSNGGGS